MDQESGPMQRASRIFVMRPLIFVTLLKDGKTYEMRMRKGDPSFVNLYGRKFVNYEGLLALEVLAGNIALFIFGLIFQVHACC